MSLLAVHCVDYSWVLVDAIESMMEVDAPSEHVEASRSVHMSLYKKKGANWREELRKKCAQHLRERREEAVSKARGLNEAVEREEINKIIREEIEAMRRSEQFEDEDLNAAIEDFEQIREELLQQGVAVMSPLLYFDACTVTCERCEFYFHLPVEMPCAAELSAYFMQIFNTHTNRKCDVVPSVIVQGP
uniref:RPA-interacting protein N-terminal domain-containing protein n=1 Tax=Parascaris equorum TaxID=6256 RepID=A0A914RWJ5_PAREQ